MAYVWIYAKSLRQCIRMHFSRTIILDSYTTSITADAFVNSLVSPKWPCKGPVQACLQG